MLAELGQASLRSERTAEAAKMKEHKSVLDTSINGEGLLCTRSRCSFPPNKEEAPALLHKLGLGPASPTHTAAVNRTRLVAIAHTRHVAAARTKPVAAAHTQLVCCSNAARCCSSNAACSCACTAAA